MDAETITKIQNAYATGQLRVRAVEAGEVRDAVVSKVLRHSTPNQPMFAVTVKSGTVKVTGDHSLFLYNEGRPTPVRADQLKHGDVLAVVHDGQVGGETIEMALVLSPEKWTYDLSVPGPQNFVLANGILAHNSYSIGGVSLDLEKSSKYEGAYSSLSEQFDKQLELSKATVNIVRGLQQPRFGMGLRSAFGPYVGRGVLSPAKFIGF